MALGKFQSTTTRYYANGVIGDAATTNPTVATDRNYIAGDAALTIGNFAWADPANPVAPAYHGSGIFKALSSTPAPGEDETAAAPLGIIRRVLDKYIYDLREGSTILIPEDAAMTIMVNADMYVVSSTAATVGQKVFATLATGAVQTGAAGATVAGAVETDWRVTEGGPAGTLITISNW